MNNAADTAPRTFVLPVSTITPAAVPAAIEAAKAAPFTTPDRAFGGCGRVYVQVIADRKVINAVAKACEAAGLIFQRHAHYGMRNAIYLGYDTSNGAMLAKGEAFAASLKAAGLVAFMDAHGD